MGQIVLASASPRRSELLRQAGMEFVVIPSRGEEVITSTHPAEVVEELSLQKAQEVADRIMSGKEEQVSDFSVVIGADTVVAADHKILGKPADHEDARKMITMLQGNIHQVYTGVTLIVKDEKGNIHTRTFSECTDVDVCEMSEDEVEEYISTKEPYDKAGAYGIQGSFGVYIRGIRGCYYNVVAVILQECMPFTVKFIAQNFVEDYVLCAAEEIFLHLGVGLFQLGDQAFDLEALGADVVRAVAEVVLFCKFAGALQEAQAVVVAPGLDIVLADQVHGADQLHAFEVGAPEFGHHRLVLAGVEHSHENGLDHVVIVVAERYFVTAQFPGLTVKISPSHSRAEIAGGFFNVVDGVKDRGVEDRHRNSQDAAVLLDQRAVAREVAGVHADKSQRERKFVVPLDLLKEFGHQHGVLAAGDADSDVVALLDQLILDDRFFKAALQVVFELLPYTLFYIFLTARGIVPVQGCLVVQCQFAPLCSAEPLLALAGGIFLLAVSAAVDLALGIGQEEDVGQLLLNGGDASGIVAFENADDLFGHCHFLFLNDLAALDDIDGDIGIDQGYSVKAQSIGIAFHLENVLASHIVAAGVLDDRDLIVLSVEVKIMVDQHCLAGLNMVKNDSVFYFAYV